MTDQVKLLSDDEVAEIAARNPFLCDEESYVVLSESERDSLCATVRALRADIERLKALSTDQTKIETALREQLAEVQAGYQRATIGLSNLYHVITNEHCDDSVALGMATSAVGSLLRERDELQSQLAQREQEWKAFENLGKRVEANLRAELAQRDNQLFQSQVNYTEQNLKVGEIEARLAQVTQERDACWHCGTVLEKPRRPRCEDCPDECDVVNCDALGCVDKLAQQHLDSWK